MNIDCTVNAVTMSVNFKQKLLKGTTNKMGAPISCVVRAYNRRTGVMLSQTTSKATGVYILLGSHIDQNYVLALDPENNYNAVIKDRVTT